eukprot:TRINITY_DN12676_c0_g2_i1.p1 TRINITY_DN12676_c0_g2~~TRINITY_DN12676_c0_g2_i1.p1  ORF type:complete len:623 (-),score=119.67 TRINITY_DN12676_c0_g2_i1:170-2038(-)
MGEASAAAAAYVTSGPSFGRDGHPLGASRWRVRDDFNHQGEGVLSLRKNDVVYVLRTAQGWYGGHKDGCEVTGWFPQWLVEAMDSDDEDELEEEEEDSWNAQVPDEGLEHKPQGSDGYRDSAARGATTGAAAARRQRGIVASTHQIKAVPSPLRGHATASERSLDAGSQREAQLKKHIEDLKECLKKEQAHSKSLERRREVEAQEHAHEVRRLKHEISEHKQQEARLLQHIEALQERTRADTEKVKQHNGRCPASRSPPREGYGKSSSASKQHEVSVVNMSMSSANDRSMNNDRLNATTRRTLFKDDDNSQLSHSGQQRAASSGASNTHGAAASPAVGPRDVQPIQTAPALPSAPPAVSASPPAPAATFPSLQPVPAAQRWQQCQPLRGSVGTSTNPRAAAPSARQANSHQPPAQQQQSQQQGAGPGSQDRNAGGEAPGSSNGVNKLVSEFERRNGAPPARTVDPSPLRPVGPRTQQTTQPPTQTQQQSLLQRAGAGTTGSTQRSAATTAGTNSHRAMSASCARPVGGPKQGNETPRSSSLQRGQGHALRQPGEDNSHHLVLNMSPMGRADHAQHHDTPQQQTRHVGPRGHPAHRVPSPGAGSPSPGPGTVQDRIRYFGGLR